MKIITIMLAAMITAMPALAQIKNAKTETVKIYGNCGMCETTIEKAAAQKKLSKADWNKDTKMASITYDSKKTTLDAVLKKIALTGYDNASFLAPDDAYNKLADCCKYKRELKQPMAMTASTTMPGKNGHEGHGNMDNMQMEKEAGPLKAVFDNYFAVKDALVKSDSKLASAKAKQLETAIAAVKMDKLSMDAHMVWMKVTKDLKEDAQAIGATSDIAKQRDHFTSLSKNMYGLIKASGVEQTVYYQFCPMMNDGKGANWLSKESTIKNPYYGSQMLTCGKTVETIQK